MAKQPTRELIPYVDTFGEVHETYAIVEEMVNRYHELLRRSEAKILLIWAFNWDADADGRVVLGKAKRASDYERELKTHDAAIVLNEPIWGKLKRPQKAALIDHCLCQIQPTTDGDKFKVDADGRLVLRSVKPPVSEFPSVVRRHGLWHQDLVSFKEAWRVGESARLQQEAESLFGSPAFREDMRHAAKDIETANPGTTVEIKFSGPERTAEPAEGE